jgi:hypothetical protein
LRLKLFSLGTCQRSMRRTGWPGTLPRPNDRRGEAGPNRGDSGPLDQVVKIAPQASALTRLRRPALCRWITSRWRPCAIEKNLHAAEQAAVYRHGCTGNEARGW